MIILGIDPGTATTGYGIIEKTKKNELKCIDYGCILTSKEFSDAERLTDINKQLNKVINEYKPDAMSVENVYFFKNLKTVMPVSQAKGVILFTAAKKKLPIYEFTPLQIKMAMVGYGRAEKKQVQQMVKLLLNIEKIPKPDDAADALAVAICCSNSLKNPMCTISGKRG